jgi:hypothetical protein
MVAAGSAGHASIQTVPSDAQLIKLNENYEVDLKLLTWYNPAKTYYVCTKIQCSSAISQLYPGCLFVEFGLLFQVIFDLEDKPKAQSLPGKFSERESILGADFLYRFINARGHLQVIGELLGRPPYVLFVRRNC